MVHAAAAATLSRMVLNSTGWRRPGKTGRVAVGRGGAGWMEWGLCMACGRVMEVDSFHASALASSAGPYHPDWGRDRPEPRRASTHPSDMGSARDPSSGFTSRSRDAAETVDDVHDDDEPPESARGTPLLLSASPPSEARATLRSILLQCWRMSLAATGFPALICEMGGETATVSMHD